MNYLDRLESTLKSILGMLKNDTGKPAGALHAIPGYTTLENEENAARAQHKAVKHIQAKKRDLITKALRGELDNGR